MNEQSTQNLRYPNNQSVSMDELSSPNESGGQQSRPSAIDTILKDSKQQNLNKMNDKKQAVDGGDDDEDDYDDDDW